MYQTIVFDLDGTLLNTIDDLAAAGNAACRDFGWPEHSVDAYKAMVGHGMVNLATRFAPPGADVQAALARFNAHYGPHSADRTRPYPGMVDLVTRLHQEGVRMAVYSNKADNFTRDLMARFFPGVFALVQGKREGVPVKPDPTGLRGILRALDADPARTLYVGDSATDIRTGHNASLTVCAVTWGFRPRERLLEADCLADDAAALERVIREG